ncbi:MAG: PorT family protein [Candidatus Aminicenantes bacterium]|nr:PorT family protein [Candidatus Aminicenantes bacterium]
MRRFLIFWMVLVISVVFSTFTLAVDFGIKGGVNFAKLKLEYFDIDGEFEDEVIPVTNLRAFQIGAFFTFKVSKNISIQPEIYYVKKGTKASQSESTQWYSYNMESIWKLHYIEIPVLLKINIPTKGKFKPGFLIGPYVAHNIKAKMWAKTTHEFQGEKFVDEGEEDILYIMESLDYGLIIGSGMDIKIGSGKLVFDIRYCHGLANIFKYLGVVRNKTFVFMVGFGF